MKKTIISAILILICFIPNLFAQQQMKDVVYLTNGSIVKGIIAEQVPNEYLKIITADGSIFVFNMEDILKITKEPYADSRIENKKSPVFAFVLSFLLTGLGQYYNGDVAKGLTQEVMVIGGGLTALTFGIDTDVTLDGTKTKLTPLFWIGMGTAFTGYLWSMIDAPVSANRINREYSQQSYGHMIEYYNNRYTLGLDVATNKDGIGAMFTIHF